MQIVSNALLWQLRYGRKTLKVYREKIPVSTISPLEWLSSQDIYPKVYWKHRDEQKSIATLGKIHECACISSLVLENVEDRDDSPRWFIAKDFDSNSAYTFLPLLELHATASTCYFIAQWTNEEEKDQAFSLIEKSESYLSSFTKTKWGYKTRVDTPNFQEWQTATKEALDTIQNLLLQKLVLARKAIFTLHESCNPLEMLSVLQKKQQNTTVFALCFSPEKAFIGCSPEVLFSRKNNKITTEAVAGTRRRGVNPQEDEQYKEELLHSSKEQAEFLYVKKRIETLLQKFSSNILQTNISPVIATAHVQHLYASYQAVLKQPLVDKLLVNAFHPTPAVCGSPKKKSLEKLLEIELFKREFYASPIGWQGVHQSEFIVAIRSALIEREQISVFAGVGLVDGSNSSQEWEELNNKIKPFTEILSWIQGH